jgi:hypothetical protein
LSPHTIENIAPPDALGVVSASRIVDVERVCEFVLASVQSRAGTRALQGARIPPLACRSGSPLVRFFAERRLCRVPTAVAHALVAWADGFPVTLLTRVPSPDEVLELQSVGERCVSILSDDVETAPHANALEFALHDLCHLDKFIDPEHHLGQVGFFAKLRAARAHADWPAFESLFDVAFQRDFAHVSADMNGSAVFLFAALKMRLKMAARRRYNVDANCLRTSGPLDEAEEQSYRAAEGDLFELLGLRGDLADAGRNTSTRRGDPRSAMKLLCYFEEAGSLVNPGERKR